MVDTNEMWPFQIKIILITIRYNYTYYPDLVPKYNSLLKGTGDL